MRFATGLIAAVDIADFWWQLRRIVAFYKSRVLRMDRTTGETTMSVDRSG